RSTVLFADEPSGARSRDLHGGGGDRLCGVCRVFRLAQGWRFACWISLAVSGWSLRARVGELSASVREVAVLPPAAAAAGAGWPFAVYLSFWIHPDGHARQA